MNIPVALTATGCVLLLASGGVPAADNPGRGQGPKPRLTTTVLEFQTMVGVNGPFLGGANPIRGVNGGGLPWVLDAAKGELRDDGKLEVQVEGLVIPEGDAPPVCEPGNCVFGCGADCLAWADFRYAQVPRQCPVDLSTLAARRTRRLSSSVASWYS